MFRIDNKYYNVEFLMDDGYIQTADILNGENSGRLQGTGSMYLDYVGTFFNSSFKFRKCSNCTDTEWNDFYLAVANPKNDHNIDIPFNKGILTLNVYFSQVQRKLRKINLVNDKRIPVWEKIIEFKAIPMDSNWLAGNSLTGYSEA